MLQKSGEVIGQRTFYDGLFEQLFLSKPPQQVQAVLVSFHNNALEELAASVDRILEITKSSTEVFSVKKASNDRVVIHLRVILIFITTVSDHTPHVEALHDSKLGLASWWSLMICVIWKLICSLPEKAVADDIQPMDVEYIA
ncbi:unnamed protein product [Schistosoma margrebowiei]|uniref:Uncharacterized protein n=1 Tax=Schistosoma margrebowiei TaxID=48269 RepID=A0A183MMV8_9TREM|nr:unnamed protein product [Schistosoma margrebowiei]